MAYNINDFKASLSVLQYSEEKSILFTPITKIKSDNDNRIEFSLLLQIKQKDESTPIVAIELIRFQEPVLDEETETEIIRRQDAARLHLSDIRLDNNDEPQLEMGRLMHDPWHICQIIRVNFTDVPTKGSGSYAVVAYLKDEEAGELSTLQDKEFLDCSYFEVD